MAETNYKVELLDSSVFKIFKGVYNDFRSKAVSEYKFELEPLEYEEFLKDAYLEINKYAPIERIDWLLNKK